MDNNDDSSSDSSIDDHFQSVDKINLNSSFFKIENKAQLKKVKSRNRRLSSDDDDNNDNDDNDDNDDDDDIGDYDQVSTTALLAEVMKNLEKVNGTGKENVASPIPSTSKSSLQENESSDNNKKKDSLSNEINNLLLLGESNISSSNYQEPSDSDTENKNESKDPSNYSIPQEGVDITLPNDQLMFNHKKKRQLDLLDELRKKLNRRLRSNQIFIHKVGILCWLAHGIYLNKQTSDPEVMAIALSLIPQKSYPKGRIDLKYLEKFTKWFKNSIEIQSDNKIINNCQTTITKDVLIKCLSNKKVHDYRELVLLYISVLRAIGVNCRLIISLYPPNLKPKTTDLYPTQNPKNGDRESKLVDGDKVKKECEAGLRNESRRKKKSRVQNKNNKNELKERETLPSNSKSVKMLEAKKHAAEVLRSKYMKKNNVEKKFSHDITKRKSTEIEDEVEAAPSGRQLRSHTNKRIKTEVKNLEVIPSKSKCKPVKASVSDSDEDEKKKKTMKKVDNKNNSKVNAAKRKSLSCDDSDSADFIDRRVLSSDEDFDDENKRSVSNSKYHYLWVEVYVESEENWISISVADDKIHCINEIYRKLPTPVLYIMAFDSREKIKDVTRRYCSNWLTTTRKQRIDENWLNQTLSHWEEPENALSKAEDEFLAMKEMEQPLPKSISECKGHPLYALVRHLLKFEALYPPDCVPLGHLKNGEAIYSRHCVHTLRSRETWLKQARVVKPSQDPYKIVKAMPKYDKLSGQMIKNQPLELFGHWQTMAYVPPEAKDGKVPRNEYGNVDLFQKSMLPKGTVHIDLPCLYRVAKKLNIDCVPAVVGFNFGGRGAMPMTQGYVVCEEYEDELREAWEEEQIKAVEREKQKREKRIWGNWRKLIRGLLIKKKIIAKYDLEQEHEKKDKNKN